MDGKLTWINKRKCFSRQSDKTKWTQKCEKIGCNFNIMNYSYFCEQYYVYFNSQVYFSEKCLCQQVRFSQIKIQFKNYSAEALMKLVMFIQFQCCQMHLIHTRSTFTCWSKTLVAMDTNFCPLNILFLHLKSHIIKWYCWLVLNLQIYVHVVVHKCV